jgi:DNA-directed RNA polymerase subunit RPC12/RpoP
MAITIGEFNKFFTEVKAGTYKCAFCGTETFVPNAYSVLNSPRPSTQAEIDALPVAALHMPAGVEAAFAGIDVTHPFYSFSCARCGRTDFFHSRQVGAWLEEQKAKAKEKPEGGNE